MSVLTAEEVRQRLEQARREAGLKAGFAATGVPAAVLIGLLGYLDGPEVILTERTADLSNHPSEISLPGGRIDEGDRDPAAAALREACEEVGLPPEKVRVLGHLGGYQTVSGFLVHPVVGWIDPPVEFKPNPREVAEIFTVPLAFVLNTDNYRRELYMKDDVPHSVYVLRYPGRCIWGATAGMLVSLARALKEG